MHEPTDEQNAVLLEPSSCVVIARPGSGKTATLASKIEGLLRKLPEHKGVAAISFTNKASEELKRRCLAGGVPKRASFFGTIDSFFISEILAFLPHVYGNISKEFEIKLLGERGGVFREFIESRRLGFAPNEESEFLRLYRSGILPLELVGKLAVAVFDGSSACRRYLKSRYSHVAIDEYQDSGFEQHGLFLRLVELGIIGVAVGDLDQSIYAFSNRSPEFLTELTQRKDFKSFALTKNHRCHPSIVYYSLRLFTPAIELPEPTELRVCEKSTAGNESAVARWLDIAIPKAAERFSIKENREIAVLFRSNRTGEILSKNLTTPHKLFSAGPFDEDQSLWGGIFQKVLRFLFDPAITKLEMVEEYLSSDFDIETAKASMSLLRQLQDAAATAPERLAELKSVFVAFAELIYPRAENISAVDRLEKILGDPDMFESFFPAKSHEVQLMTLHKAKGLEFDFVFHLDLHEWIIPGYPALKGDQGQLIQDLNLHYVGITRARKCVTLCTSTERTNTTGASVKAAPSSFLLRNELHRFRRS